jgi:16S rRNA (adenine1518-N6/adenine1519-N6)-dimethyltransferase
VGAHLLRAKRFLDQFNIKPEKSLGQNFITSAALLAKIVEAAQIDKEDLVLEIGAGLGTLTQALAERARRVIALEIDPRLMSALKVLLSQCTNVQLAEGDTLKVNIHELLREPNGALPPFKVVANLPYYATSAILRQILEDEPKPKLMVVTVQKEVGERIVAGPGEMSVLSVSVQLYGRPRIVARAPAGAFYPSPKVSSVVLRIEPYEVPLVEIRDKEAFFRLVRAGFSQRRKYLKNSLLKGLGLPEERISAVLEQAGIDGRLRPQALSLEDWYALYRALWSF